jgi:carbamate kinase
MGTDVEGAMLHFGTPDQKFLRRLSVREAETHLEMGEFPPGSMGSKIEAAVNFIKSGGKRAVICSIDSIEDAVAGRAGTEVEP